MVPRKLGFSIFMNLGWLAPLVMTAFGKDVDISGTGSMSMSVSSDAKTKAKKMRREGDANPAKLEVLEADVTREEDPFEGTQIEQIKGPQSEESGQGPFAQKFEGTHIEAREDMSPPREQQVNPIPSSMPEGEGNTSPAELKSLDAVHENELDSLLEDETDEEEWEQDYRLTPGIQTPPRPEHNPSGCYTPKWEWSQSVKWEWGKQHWGCRNWQWRSNCWWFHCWGWWNCGWWGDIYGNAWRWAWRHSWPQVTSCGWWEWENDAWKFYASTDHRRRSSGHACSTALEDMPLRRRCSQAICAQVSSEGNPQCSGSPAMPDCFCNVGRRRFGYHWEGSKIKSAGYIQPSYCSPCIAAPELSSGDTQR